MRAILLDAATQLKRSFGTLAFLVLMARNPVRLPPLDLLQAFAAAARHLSFTRAAGERALTQTAMSRQIKALEDDLGVLLFTRGRRGLQLTREGERLNAVVAEALD